MATSTLPKSYLQAIQKIKNKGFTYIKVELEAELGRGDANANCDDCDEGWNRCDECDGDGHAYVYDRNGERKIDSWGDEVTEECRDCSGEGTIECRNCSGRGRSRDGYSVEYCQDYLEEKVSAEARRALVYGDFYEDGSVDSEYTFTMPIDKAHLCIEFIEAFNDLNYEINGGSSPDVENAGMHITVMPESKYPCTSGLLDIERMENYRAEVTKLLPALYFVASHKAYTRRLEYRLPEVSHENKYSAIYTHGDTCMEYRIFDTCYDDPHALLEKIEVIASTLRYYSMTDKVGVKYKRFVFPAGRDGYGGDLREYFLNIDNLDALNQTLKHVKPGSKTIKSLKAERNVTVTKKSLIKELERYMESHQNDYYNYAARTAKDNDYRITDFFEIEERRFNEYGYASRYVNAYLRVSFTEDELKAFFTNRPKALKWIKKHASELDVYIEPALTLRQFIQNHVIGRPGGVVLNISN